MKIYKNKESFGNYEKETGKASYRTLFDRLCPDAVLCNEIIKYFFEDLEIVLGSDYDEENDEYDEVYQWFIVDVDNWVLEKFQEHNVNDILLYYCEKLDVYIVGVTHFGTSWDYVNTSVELTDNPDEAW